MNAPARVVSSMLCLLFAAAAGATALHADFRRAVLALVSAADEPGTAAPAAAPSAVPAAPDPIAIGLAALPGTSGCVVDRHGIRKKAIPLREGVALVDRPEGCPVGATLPWFEPQFVLEELPAQGDARWLCVCDAPGRTSGSRPVGWVRREDVAIWPTRVGVRPARGDARGAGPLLVYAEPEAWIEILTTGATRRTPIARACGGAARAFHPWPVTQIESVTLPDGSVHELHRIEFLAARPLGVAEAGVAPHTGAATAAATYDATRIAAIAQSTRMLDVVFCLDVTGSMQPYIDATKKTVLGIAERLRALPSRPSIAFGLVAYRDHDAESGFVTEVSDLCDAPTFERRLGALRASGGGDAHEAVWDAVQAALEKPTFRGEGLSDRIVILCGDAPAHEPGESGNPYSISQERLIALAASKRARVFALAVGTHEPTRLQFARLATRAGGECSPIADAGALVARIAAIVDARVEVVNLRGDTVERLGRGEAPAAIALAEGVEIGRVTEVLEFLAGAGVDFSRLQPGVPSHGSGWILAHEKGVATVEREVHCARSEISALIGVVNLLCASALDPRFGETVHRFAAHARVDPMALLLDGAGESARIDAFLMAQGIPVGRASVLRRTRSELTGLPELERRRLRDRLAREVVPALVQARNDDALWTMRGSDDWGWVGEGLLP